ncbi:pyridoxine 5'-phosphate synthase [Pseudoprevotella muciniphila]|uniref:Pyridoxine 5'-phosphate synthase n=1 Tax=Pseudoprevotella muciniphila TaxID=2133944 RepID=A0A5P8E4N2_9BACT|nr:pyridoxine 5'-phosphate synthase [Pseudoprevotella muciniphila]QFQ11884.1 pyridoxine 5'-phosphate synthase [Pseudoprevotella muciniphila]
MTKLSVNVNKIATLRNSRGGNNPDLLKVSKDIERFGGQGITVHPRPDERHIRYQDVRDLKQIVNTEFNIEGYPSDDFCKLVCEVCPTQVTLVPDSPDQLTSNHGWDTKHNVAFLTDITQRFKTAGIRVSIFIDADIEMAEYALKAGADRIELYTEPYASGYTHNRELAIAPFVETANHCKSIGLGINAGHDLSLENLQYFHERIPFTDEVSIGHALICDALYSGLKQTVHAYLECLK